MIDLIEGRHTGAEITASEISGQADYMADTAAVVFSMRDELSRFMAEALAEPELRVVLTGAGSSAFVGEILAATLRKECGLDAEAVHTTDIVSAPECFLPCSPTLLVSFARSGDSPESVAAARTAEKHIKKLYQLVVVCNKNSYLSRYAEGRERTLVIHVPQECCDDGFAMTASVTNMLAAAWLAFNTATLDARLRELDEVARLMNANLSRYSELARKVCVWDYDRMAVLGTGALKGLAKECAMKSLELTRGAVYATADAPTGFRHGPKCMISPRTLSVHLISADPKQAQYDLDLLKELCSQREGNRVLALHPERAADDYGADMTVDGGLASDNDLYAALTLLPFMQLLALNKSISLGIRPDSPYYDSGKVNRVVQGVVIHDEEESPR